MGRNYWLNLFTGTTWEEFQEAGSHVTGFRESRWKIVQKINKGDYFLCYLTGVSRFIGILEATSESFKVADQDIWKDEDFPCRLYVKPVVELKPETAVPVFELQDQLSCFQNLKSPHAWTGQFRSSPAKWKQSDGEAVVQAVMEAKRNPVKRPVDQKKLKYRPKPVRAKMGTVTVPESNDVPEAHNEIKDQRKTSDHTEMQWLLLRLGSDMKFDVWVARNDRNKEFDGKRFVDLPRMKTELPLQFDDATNKTIEVIDVLWLKGNAIISAFEIESTTTIYSGLLRMADLIAMQPNINIPLYIVAPDERREKVISEVNRPTFHRLSPPLSEICRFISFTSLKAQIKQVAPYIRYMRPEFLNEMSESCVLEDI